MEVGHVIEGSGVDGTRAGEYDAAGTSGGRVAERRSRRHAPDDGAWTTAQPARRPLSQADAEHPWQCPFSVDVLGGVEHCIRAFRSRTALRQHHRREHMCELPRTYRLGGGVSEQGEAQDHLTRRQRCRLASRVFEERHREQRRMRQKLALYADPQARPVNRRLWQSARRAAAPGASEADVLAVYHRMVEQRLMQCNKFTTRSTRPMTPPAGAGAGAGAEAEEGQPPPPFEVPPALDTAYLDEYYYAEPLPAYHDQHYGAGLSLEEQFGFALPQ